MSHPPVLLGSVLLGIGLLALIDRHPLLLVPLALALAVAVVAASLRRRPRTIDLPDHVAGLMRTNGWRTVSVSAAMGRLGTDVTGVAADGRRWVVRCHRDAAILEPADVLRFAEAVHGMRRADVHALFTTGPITDPVREAARRCRTTLLDRNALTDSAARR